MERILPCLKITHFIHLTDDSHPGSDKSRLLALADLQKKLADMNREAALASGFIPAAG